MGGQSSHLDLESFEAALEAIAARVYGPGSDVRGARGSVLGALRDLRSIQSVFVES